MESSTDCPIVTDHQHDDDDGIRSTSCKKEESIPVLTFATWLRENRKSLKSPDTPTLKTKASRFEKVRFGDFRFFDPFVNDGNDRYPAASIGLIVPDEINTIKRLSSSLPPTEQRLVMSVTSILS